MSCNVGSRYAGGHLQSAKLFCIRGRIEAYSLARLVSKQKCVSLFSVGTDFPVLEA